MDEILSIESHILQVLRYAPETGLLFWTDKAYLPLKGKQAGTKHTQGYVVIETKRKRFFAHRVAWLFAYGKFPDGDIDHINGNPADNRIQNLSDVSCTVNMQNQRKAQSHSSTGLLGVSRNGAGWQSQIRINGKRKQLGTFSTPQQAHEAYVSAKRQYHEGCTI